MEEMPTLSGGAVPDISLNDMSKDEKIRTVSLMMSINYHSKTVISDGILYQQYKLEGRNFRTLDDEQVIATAVRYETYIRCGENPERMALIEQVADEIDAELAKDSLDATTNT